MNRAGQTDIGDWIGRTETAFDLITAQPVAGMSATLDRDDPEPQPGDPLPPMWHWMYFTPKAAASEIGPDGHPRRGGFLPPVSLPRRMFAGASYEFAAPLRVGDRVRRESEIVDVAEKQGRSGQLVFVQLRHDWVTDEGPAIREIQDIVYREESAGDGAAGGDTGKPAAGDMPADWRREITPDPVTLFRYSALTFNGHRIHYDRPYAMEVEGYPGLVVHGPLIATFLVELCRVESGDRPISAFRFRAKRPLFDIAPFTVTGGPTGDGDGFRLAALTREGTIAMEADGRFGEYR